MCTLTDSGLRLIIDFRGLGTIHYTQNAVKGGWGDGGRGVWGVWGVWQDLSLIPPSKKNKIIDPISILEIKKLMTHLISTPPHTFICVFYDDPLPFASWIHLGHPFILAFSISFGLKYFPPHVRWNGPLYVRDLIIFYLAISFRYCSFISIQISV